MFKHIFGVGCGDQIHGYVVVHSFGLEQLAFCLLRLYGVLEPEPLNMASWFREPICGKHNTRTHIYSVLEPEPLKIPGKHMSESEFVSSGTGDETT